MSELERIIHDKLYQNPTASLPRIEYNFSDYIYCEKVKKYTPKYFSDREYWIERLAEFPEKPDLPIINAVAHCCLVIGYRSLCQKD